MVAVAEYSYYLFSTGDLMFRSHAMIHHNESLAALDANHTLRWRLFRAYPEIVLLWWRSFGLHSLFALLLVIPACFFLSISKWRLLVLWALLPFLYLNFGTSSLSHYWALPAVDRYLLFLYPPLFLLSSYFLLELGSRNPRAAPAMTLGVSVIAFFGFWCGFSGRQQAWRTDAIKELRIIGDNARKDNFRTVAFAGTQPEEWQAALGILNHELQPATDLNAADITIRADAFKLPSVVSSRRALTESGQPTGSTER
jgi:hypothetical protein